MISRLNLWFLCCTKNILIGVLSLIFLVISLTYNLIEFHHNMVVLLLWFTIYLEMSKTIIQMLLGDDAPIMIRYASAGMIIVSFKEMYIHMIEKNIEWMLYSAISIIFFLIVRFITLKMTTEGR